MSEKGTQNWSQRNEQTLQLAREVERLCGHADDPDQAQARSLLAQLEASIAQGRALGSDELAEQADELLAALRAKLDDVSGDQSA